MNPFLTYAIIGLATGVLVAVREYHDGVDMIEAGLAGVFVACFWPIVGAVMALGIIAFGISRLIWRRPQ